MTRIVPKLNEKFIQTFVAYLPQILQGVRKEWGRLTAGSFPLNPPLIWPFTYRWIRRGRSVRRNTDRRWCGTAGRQCQRSPAEVQPSWRWRCMRAASRTDSISASCWYRRISSRRAPHCCPDRPCCRPSSSAWWRHEHQCSVNLRWFRSPVNTVRPRVKYDKTRFAWINGAFETWQKPAKSNTRNQTKKTKQKMIITKNKDRRAK